jgi:hypothetical protein
MKLILVMIICYKSSKDFECESKFEISVLYSYSNSNLRTMCGSRTGGWSLPCVMSD